MVPLYLYFQSSNMVNLDGLDPAETVIQSCRLVSKPSSGGETVDELLELALEGAAGDIAARVTILSQLLELTAVPGLPARDWLYLRYYDPGSETVPAFDWKSRILGGRLELGGNGLADREAESQLVRLHLTRLNYWAAPATLATAFEAGDEEPYGRDPVDDISSHQDAGHTNSFGICGHNMIGDLPAPVELRIENVRSGDTYGNFTLSQRIVKGTGRTDCGFVEAEDLSAGAGVTQAISSDPTCSNGQFASFNWSGSAEMTLCSWTPAEGELSIMDGKVHRPILRLQAACTYTDLWACVRVFAYGSSQAVQESLWMLIPANTLYVELPAVNIPPALSGFDSYRSVTVALCVKRSSGGSSSLAVDFVQFTPAEHVRRITSLGLSPAVGRGKYLVDSGIEQATWYQDAAGARETTHVGLGEYFQVIPGYDSMVRVLHRAPGDAAWPVTPLFDFHVYYEPRRRTL